MHVKLTNAILVGQIHASKGERVLEGEWFSKCIHFVGDEGQPGFLFSESSNPHDLLGSPVKLLRVNGVSTMHGQHTDWAAAVGKIRYSLKRRAEFGAGPNPSCQGDFKPVGVFAAASVALIPIGVGQYTPGAGAGVGQIRWPAGAATSSYTPGRPRNPPLGRILVKPYPGP